MSQIEPGNTENTALSQDQIDIIGEVSNISMGSAATALSNIIGKKVTITSPHVMMGSKSAIESIERIPSIGVSISYTEGIKGQDILIIRKADATEIVKVLMGGELPDDEEFGELHLSAIGEVMNQMMGASATALSGFIGRSVNISPPTAFVLTDENKVEKLKLLYDGIDRTVLVKFLFQVENMFESDIYMIMTHEFSQELVRAMLKTMGIEPPQEEQPVTASQPQPAAAPQEPVARVPQPAQEPEPEPYRPEPVRQPDPVPYQQEAPRQADPYAYPPQPQVPLEQPRQAEAAAARAMQQTMVRPAVLPDFGPISPLSGEEAGNFELIQEVPLELSVEVGRAKKLVREVIDFTVGSIVELDKQAGDPVDIIVNGQLIAHGEVVVIDESFGVRVTDIITKKTKGR